MGYCEVEERLGRGSYLYGRYSRFVSLLTVGVCDAPAFL